MKAARNHSEETKRKLRMANLGSKNPMFGRKISERHKKIISSSVAGVNNPSWKGGSSIYRKLAFEEYRMEKKCETCGSLKLIDVHHIDKDKYNNKKENLQILCRSCHTRHHATGRNNPMYGVNRSGKNHPMHGRKHSAIARIGMLKGQIKRRTKESIIKLIHDIIHI